MSKSRGICKRCRNWGTTTTTKCFKVRFKSELLGCSFFDVGIGPAKGYDRLAHRKLAEKAIGRKLRIDEYVHHLNGNHYDNRPGNLLICGTEYHAFLHRMMRGHLHLGDVSWAKYKTNTLRRARLDHLENAMLDFLASEGTLAAYRDPAISARFPSMKRGAMVNERA